MILEYEQLLSLANRPDRKEPMMDATVSATAVNASCGDACTVHLKVINGVITDADFDAKGCVISRASAAVIVDHAIGVINSARSMNGDSVRSLLGVAISPLRERCLTTPLKALQDAISNL